MSIKDLLTNKNNNLFMPFKKLKYFQHMNFFEQSYILEKILTNHDNVSKIKFSKNLLNEILIFNNWSQINIDQLEDILLYIESDHFEKKRPLSKIFQEKSFYGDNFYTDENVHCPRPETEQLIEIIKSKVNNPENFLDLGTGSGVIAITLKKLYPKAEVFAIDISEKALEVAKKNAKNLKINFIRNNWLQNINGSNNLVCNITNLVSNPPYLSEQEIKDELFYDPKISLYGGIDGLDYYRKISEKKYLFQNIFLEINYNHVEELKSLFNNCELFKDLNGDLRFLFWSNPHYFSNNDIGSTNHKINM